MVSKTAAKDFLSAVLRSAEPALNEAGYEVVTAQCPLEGSRPVLRIFIDRLADIDAAQPEVESIGLDDCAAASRIVDELIERENLDAGIGDYFLEMSSPGLDRPLIKESDYRRFAGKRIKLKLRRDGRNAAYKGRLCLKADNCWAVETEEGTIEFDLADVSSCRLLLDEMDF